eukprot:SAG31_NODE_10583_length_1121_cov_1.354207_2_plen_139_part_01
MHHASYLDLGKMPRPELLHCGPLVCARNFQFQCPKSSQSVGFPTDRQDLNCIVASFVDSAYSLSMMVKFLRRCCEQNHSKVLTSLRACARTQAQTCVGWYAAAQGALGYRLMSVPLCDSHSGAVCLLKATGLSNFVITS